MSLAMTGREGGWRNYCIVLFLIWNYGKHLSTNANHIQSTKTDFHTIWPCLISLLDHMNYRDFALIYFCLCMKHCVLVHLLCLAHQTQEDYIIWELHFKRSYFNIDLSSAVWLPTILSSNTKKIHRKQITLFSEVHMLNSNSRTVHTDAMMDGKN